MKSFRPNNPFFQLSLSPCLPDPVLTFWMVSGLASFRLFFFASSGETTPLIKGDRRKLWACCKVVEMVSLITPDVIGDGWKLACVCLRYIYESRYHLKKNIPVKWMWVWLFHLSAVAQYSEQSEGYTIGSLLNFGCFFIRKKVLPVVSFSFSFLKVESWEGTEC